MLIAPVLGRTNADPAPPTPPTPPAPTMKRETYDSENKSFGIGKLVRKEGDAPVADATANTAHDNAGIVYNFLQTLFKRDSIDGAGMVIKSTVHYGNKYNNAFWNGQWMTYGDGDGKLLGPLADGLDVVGHEMTHGVVEHTAGLRYRNMSGALNESWADVFGELMEQWSENKSGFGTVDAAKAADWLVGEDVFTPGVDGDAIRSLKAPGTAYKSDPQPGHMKDYVKTTKDNGGVHINSGIPNKAAYEVAMRIGSEKLAQVWYKALSDHLRPDSTFSDAANATMTAVKNLYGVGGAEWTAVRDAWRAVGIDTAAMKDADRRADNPTIVSDHGRHGFLPDFLADGVVSRDEVFG